MKRETKLKEIRERSKMLLEAVPIEEVYPGVVQHPFTNSRLINYRGVLVDLLEDNVREEWIKTMKRDIDRADVEIIFYLMINPPWYMTWLELIKPFLSKKDFSKYFAEAWTEMEFPSHCDKKALIKRIKSFENGDKRVMMDEAEYERWLNLPDEVVLYRGINSAGRKDGLSWTTDKEVAKWFQNRFVYGDDKGTLLRVKVPKKYCLACFDSRNEHEVILKTDAAFVKNNIEVIAA